MEIVKVHSEVVGDKYAIQGSADEIRTLLLDLICYEGWIMEKARPGTFRTAQRRYNFMRRLLRELCSFRPPDRMPTSGGKKYRPP